ncbi:MAG: hypothetical protein IPM74_17645 [Crocinitomicaceae bacterium]|nr:hypothetical protein [Crocinitomicaceae bacterium]MBK8927671.1 hypothetical protein [Crocinitomicaceae bacterium]
MNPIQLLQCLCIGVVFFSCAGQSETSNSQPSDTTQVITDAPDTSSHEAFIESVKKFRMASEQNSPGFEVSGNLFFEGSAGFKIYNFQESFDDYQLNIMFSIVLNGNTDFQNIQAGNDVFTQVPEWLNKNQIQATIYEGNFSTSYDFQKDNSKDFLLSSEKSFRDRIIASKKIVLFDGLNGLKNTEIMANSDYAMNDGVLDGHKEDFTFVEGGKKPATIYLDHAQTGNLGGEGTNREIHYQLVWQWQNLKENLGDSYWETGFRCTYESCIEQLEFFKTKRCQLSEGTDGYFMKENCQNGGADYFQLVDHNYLLTSCIRKDDNNDDIGSDYLVTIFQDYTKYTLFFVRSEKVDLNVNGYRDVLNEFTPYYITVYEEDSGIEKHETADGFGSATYTRFCESYNLMPCDYSN